MVTFSGELRGLTLLLTEGRRLWFRRPGALGPITGRLSCPLLSARHATSSAVLMSALLFKEHLRCRAPCFAGCGQSRGIWNGHWGGPTQGSADCPVIRYSSLGDPATLKMTTPERQELLTEHLQALHAQPIDLKSHLFCLSLSTCKVGSRRPELCTESRETGPWKLFAA